MDIVIKISNCARTCSSILKWCVVTNWIRYDMMTFDSILLDYEKIVGSKLY